MLSSDEYVPTLVDGCKHRVDPPAAIAASSSLSLTLSLLLPLAFSVVVSFTRRLIELPVPLNFGIAQLVFFAEFLAAAACSIAGLKSAH